MQRQLQRRLPDPRRRQPLGDPAQPAAAALIQPAAEAGVPALRLESVRKTFGETVAVRDLTWEVPQGSVCGVLGPNGAGKSTTIRMIMSILEPDAGRIEVLGGEARELKDAIGYLPETRGVYPRMRVADYLRYIGRLKGMAPRAASDAVDRWLARVDLPDVHRSRCNDLSKGMLQKVQIVAAVMNAPALLILDEPFSGLDPLNAVHVLGIIEELRAAGTTILFSTHVLEQAERICDRILILNRGEKLEDGALETIRAAFDPLTIEVEPAVGSPTESGALAALAALDGVRGVYPLPDERVWEIRLGGDAEPERVMQRVVAQIPVRAIQLRRATLQDLFLQLVGEHEADG